LLKKWLIKSCAIKKGLQVLDIERKEHIIEVAVNCSKAKRASDVKGSLLESVRLIRRLSVGLVNSEVEEELILMLIR
jgi:hypothetical protein